MSSRAKRYIDAFKAADTDGSGMLTREELIATLRDNGMASARADKLMEKLDLNGDGIITFGEYKVALNISSQPLETWKQLFKSIDKDGSGTLSAEELKDFLRRTGSEDLQDSVYAWMKVYDTNKDGQLNYQEFLGYIASLEE